MTPHDLAEKLVLIATYGDPLPYDDATSEIESILIAALEERNKEVEMSPMPCGCRWVKVLDCKLPNHQSVEEVKAAGYEQGQKDAIGLQTVQCHKHVQQAYEEAAKIVLAEYWNARGEESKAEEWLAEKIRQRAKEIE